ncbi:MAG: acyltransferase family protein [Acidimicrobiales bacterium]
MAGTAVEPGAAAGRHISQAGERRSARIESLRALAALAVLEGHVFGTARHYGRGAYDSFLHRALLGGGFGVFVFFALSGYLLYWPFVRRDFGSGDGRVDLRRYGLNRAIRILPLYYVGVAILLIVRDHGGSFALWWRHGLLVQALSLRTINSVDGPLWSIAVEIQFYALLPLLAWALRRLSRGSIPRAAVAVGMVGAASMAWRVWTVQMPVHPGVWQYQLPTTFCFFVPGLLLAHLRRAWEHGRPAWMHGIPARQDAWIVASAALFGVVWWRYDLEGLAAVASFLVVGAVVAPLDRGRLVAVLDWRPLAMLGVASYSLYLWHLPLVEELAGASWAPRGLPAQLGLALVVSVCVAAVSYRVVEAPFLALRRRWAPG